MVAGCLSGLETYLSGTVGQGASCLSGMGNNLQSTVGQGCNLFKVCWNLHPGHCGQGWRLFKMCQNLLPGQCGAGVHPGLAMSEPTFRALLGRGAGCLSGVAPTSRALWATGPGCFSSVRTYLQGTVGQRLGCLKWCWNPPPGHCMAGVQAV